MGFDSATSPRLFLSSSGDRHQATTRNSTGSNPQEAQRTPYTHKKIRHARLSLPEEGHTVRHQNFRPKDSLKGSTRIRVLKRLDRRLRDRGFSTHSPKTRRPGLHSDRDSNNLATEQRPRRGLLPPFTERLQPFLRSREGTQTSSHSRHPSCLPNSPPSSPPTREILATERISRLAQTNGEDWPLSPGERVHLSSRRRKWFVRENEI